MRIYRIEHKDTGNGPYRGINKVESITQNNIHTDRQHPTIWRDCDRYKTIQVEEVYYCGFSSTDQLEVWFDGYFGDLHYYGFIIAVYELDDQYCIVGSNQTAFVKHLARCIQRYAITDVIAIYSAPL